MVFEMEMKYFLDEVRDIISIYMELEDTYMEKDEDVFTKELKKTGRMVRGLERKLKVDKDYSLLY